MVQSKAATVEAWLDGLAASDRPVFDELRAACREELSGWEERMQWGMPGYGPPGADNAVSFNAQKRHIAFYAGPAAIAQCREQLGDIDCGKGCVRYRNAGEVDFGVVRRSCARATRVAPMC